MLVPEWDDTRVSVVRRLHSIAASAPPGTETFEIADHAVELALSANRNDVSPALLFRNVWRNARFVLRRRRHRELILDPLTEDTAIGRMIAEGELRGTSTQDTPDDQLVAQDLAERIRSEASRRDQRAAECFDDLVAGESLDESARNLRITPRRVKRVRAHIRAVARRLAYGSHAA